MHTNTHAPTRPRTHARAHTRTHTGRGGAEQAADKSRDQNPTHLARPRRPCSICGSTIPARVFLARSQHSGHVSAARCSALVRARVRQDVPSALVCLLQGAFRDVSVSHRERCVLWREVFPRLKCCASASLLAAMAASMCACTPREGWLEVSMHLSCSMCTGAACLSGPFCTKAAHASDTSVTCVRAGARPLQGPPRA